MKAKTNPILEELWQTKEDSAREAGDDVARIHGRRPSDFGRGKQHFAV
jgi:hypothetical protein